MDVCRRKLKFSSSADADSMAMEATNSVDSCCICGDDEFVNNTELAAHLIKHVEEYSDESNTDEHGLIYENPATGTSIPHRSNHPEYTTTSFIRAEDVPTDVPQSKSPILVDISDSDDDTVHQAFPNPVPIPPLMSRVPGFRSKRGRPSYRGNRGCR